MSSQEIRDRVLAIMTCLDHDQRLMLDVALSGILGEYEIKKKETLPVLRAPMYADIEEFKARKAVEGASPETIKLYMKTLKCFVDFHGTDLRNVTDSDVIKWLEHRMTFDGVSKITADNNRRDLSSFYTYMYETGKIKVNPMLLVKKIRYQDKPRIPLTDMEQEQLYMACKTVREMAIVSTFLASGGRVAELSHLNIDDIDLKERVIRVIQGKGSKDRRMLFNARSELYIKLYLESRKDDNKALFVSKRTPHTRVGISGLEQLISKIGKRAGIDHPIFPHLLRHTFACNALERGMPIQMLSNLMGHNKIDTTAIYAKDTFENIRSMYKRVSA